MNRLNDEWFSSKSESVPLWHTDVTKELRKSEFEGLELQFNQ